jgi:hypothetical protein
MMNDELKSASLLNVVIHHSAFITHHSLWGLSDASDRDGLVRRLSG